MSQVLVSVMLMTLVTLSILGCSNSSFDAFIAPEVPETINAEAPSADMTEINISNDNVADGITPALVNLRIRSATGNPVEGVTMGISVSGPDNVVVPCTTSNKQGQSRCMIYTTRAGLKSLKLTGAFSLVSSVMFIAPKPLRSNFAFVSTAVDMRLPSGRRVIATSGITESDFIQKDSQGTLRLRSSVLSSIIND
ncbi:hypothetical protein AZI86_00185 [Bdellovibrio bacteriovorus]|uniref:Big-1 domain-containing protein n=1 Tax=Bdellovibrio bacteriovorus TaxID=959 RepID=A0A150WM13_BDEBC|nr:hypothetical protein [Bdellovibrio bacteriovorus]KYG65533.1 hypothetical protein AZI86_00185 [Bdellovibrio bacteriovorus]